MSKKLYREFSLFDYFMTMLFRGVLICIIVFAWIHYEDNPVLVGIVICLALLLLVFAGSNEIIIFENRVVHKRNSIASLLKLEDKTCYIDDIKLARFEVPLERPEPTVGELTGVFLLTFFVSGKKVREGKLNTIFFDLVNGKSYRILTSISPEKIEKIVDLVNGLISKKGKVFRWGNVDEYLGDIN